MNTAMTRTYTFSAPVWLYQGDAPWHFLTVPPSIAAEITFFFGIDARGFGSLPVQATLGTSTWRTSIFPDKKTGSYLLPLKASVRKQEGIRPGDLVSVSLLLGSS